MPLRRILEASSSSSSINSSSSSSNPPTAATLSPGPPASLTGPTAAGSGASPGQHPYNSTHYLPDSDELEYSILAAFSDMETVLLACISTLLPLIIALGIAFGIRRVWRKYKNRRCSTDSGLPWYRGVCSREDTAESLHHRPNSGSQSLHPANQILSAQDLVNSMDGPRYICETEVMEEVALATGNVDYTSPGSHMSKNSNGNIITLTLKNNHLIVETEERAVTMEDTRHRKYEDNGCSVIVEVPPGYRNEDIDVDVDANTGSSEDVMVQVTDQQALVHREQISDDCTAAFDNVKFFGSTNTGLSQSDLSICSQDGSNPSYRYGNQLEYEPSTFSYPIYGAGCDTIIDSSNKLEGGLGTKWVEFDKSPDAEQAVPQEAQAPRSFDKIEPGIHGYMSEKCSSNNNNDSNNSTNNIYTDSSGFSLKDEDSLETKGLLDGTVHSNLNLQRMNGTMPNKLEDMEQKMLDMDLMINAKETSSSLTKPVITGAILKDEVSLQEDTFQEQQRKLGNGTLTPEHKRAEQLTKNTIKLDQNNVVTRPESSSFVPSHKRTGSIPPRLIEENIEIERKKALEIYSQIKTGTKSILPSLSPKFEVLKNEISPVDEKES